MRKSSVIAKYETRLTQTYSLCKAALKKRDEINKTLEHAKDDFAIRSTYTMMNRLNDDDITAHAYMISVLEGIVNDLHTINSLD